MPDFVIKLPVFQLGENKRGLLLSAKVMPEGHAEVTLLGDDGQTALMVMPTSRVMQAAQHGPYVVLAEVKDVGGEQVKGMGLVGADGRPL